MLGLELYQIMKEMNETVFLGGLDISKEWKRVKLLRVYKAVVQKIVQWVDVDKKQIDNGRRPVEFCAERGLYVGNTIKYTRVTRDQDGVEGTTTAQCKDGYQKQFKNFMRRARIA